jgi:hypothetical protein
MTSTARALDLTPAIGGGNENDDPTAALLCDVGEWERITAGGGSGFEATGGQLLAIRIYFYEFLEVCFYFLLILCVFFYIPTLKRNG